METIGLLGSDWTMTRCSAVMAAVEKLIGVKVRMTIKAKGVGRA